VDFAFAILAAFGLEALWSSTFRPVMLPAALDRTLKAIVIACAAALFVPALFGRPEIDPWVALSLVLIFVSYGLFRYIVRGNIGTGAQVLVVSLILFDLGAFDWSARNLQDVAKNATNHLDRLMSARGAAQFLKSRPDQFRVEVAADPTPNVGDFFGVQTVSSAGVTLPVDFNRIRGHGDYLNIRYRLMPASTQTPGAIYEDPAWKVYENPNGMPRAWTVHEARVVPSMDQAFAELEKPGFDAWRTAIVDAGAPLEPHVEGTFEGVAIRTFEPGHLEIEVHTYSRGMLVMSEMFYPGWRATVNGHAARVYRADGALRGVVVPVGDSRVVLSYTPGTVLAGAGLTFAAFAAVLAVWVRSRLA